MPNSRLSALSLLCGFAIATASFSASAEVPNILSRAELTEPVTFSLVFPPRDVAALHTLIAEQNRKGSALYHHWLTPAAYAQRFGPTEATLARVTADLSSRGLSVIEHKGQLLHVSGSAGAIEGAFGVQLSHARFSDGSVALVADRAPRMPPAIAAAGAMTPNFATAAPMQKDSHIIGPVPNNAIVPNNAQSKLGPYFAADLREAYDFPSATSLTAKGVHIAILMTGGFNASDLALYFADDGLPAALRPSVTTININGGLAYSPNTSGETHLDIQQAGAVSLSATMTLYNLNNLSFTSIIDGLNQIVSDNIADVVNMSFGGPEAGLLAANNKGISQFYLVQLEDILFAQGISQGITWVASSGDHGAIPLSAPSGKPTITPQDPATDVYVVAVGGTNLVTSYVAGRNNSTYVSESANFDEEPNGEVWGSGGGISLFWAKPNFQTLVTTASTVYRTVPDIAQHMGGCPGDAIVSCAAIDSADIEVIGGQEVGVIGTSASAPDITGLLALKVKLTGGRLGWENVDIYTRAQAQNAGGTAKPFHHKGIVGNNGYYKVAVPYDLVIGNGTADGRQLLGTTLPPAGTPGTSTNP
jgi:subtilase family serine protease